MRVVMRSMSGTAASVADRPEQASVRIDTTRGHFHVAVQHLRRECRRGFGTPGLAALGRVDAHQAQLHRLAIRFVGTHPDRVAVGHARDGAAQGMRRAREHQAQG